jgi:hypothetical protein
MQPCNRIYYSTVHWRLNMFRAAHRSSSGALTVFAASGLHTHVVTDSRIINSITRLHLVGYFSWIVSNITYRNLDSLTCEFPVRSPPTNNTLLRNFQSEIRRLERGTHHSSPSNVKVKNTWRYIAIPMHAFIVWCFVWHRQNLSFTGVYLHISYTLKSRYQDVI